MSCPHSQQHTPLICERRSGGEGCLGILAQTSFVIPLKYSDFCRECLWGHQPKCMKLIVLIYLRAVRINQLKVKNWVCKYVPVLAAAPAFRELEAKRGETDGDSCDADRGGGHSALGSHNSHLLHLKLTSQAVTLRRGGSLELTLAKNIIQTSRVENKYPKQVCAWFPAHGRQVSVTDRRRVSHSVKESSPSVTHLSRSRDNIVRSC